MSVSRIFSTHTDIVKCIGERFTDVYDYFSFYSSRPRWYRQDRGSRGTQPCRSKLLVRAAARRGTDTRFDWDDPNTYDDALAEVDRVYLVPPANSVDFAAQVGRFLDAVTQARVQHVTFLSARGIDLAPPEVALRAVELDLESRDGFTHTVLRPAWFMQNFTESFLLPGILANRQVVAPAGGGAEAFIDAEDIAAVASLTLTDPARHAGHSYTLTGPEALSFAAAAETISSTLGEPVTYVDIDPEQWTEATVAAGAPSAHTGMLANLFSVIRSGGGEPTSPDVQSLLGRAPSTFRAFADRSRTIWVR